MLEVVVARYGAEQQRQLDLGEVTEVLGCTAIARRADPDRRVIDAQACGHGRGVDAPQHVELMGDGGRLTLLGDQVLAVPLDVVGRGYPRVDAVLGAPTDPRRQLAAVAADRVGRRIAVSHVQAQEAGERGVQALD